MKEELTLHSLSVRLSDHRRLLKQHLEANHRSHEEIREVFNANMEATDRYIIWNRIWSLINTVSIVVLIVLRACA